MIQELHVQTMGASVEFGNVQGGVINVVTKQGGRHACRRDLVLRAAVGLHRAAGRRPGHRAARSPSSGYERVRFRDLTTNLGGPVKRNRLWFFGAYQYLRDYDSQPGADPAFPRKYEQNKVFGKLTGS